ncbi:MAG TPA: phosphatase PAP2 family protein, partial [Actinomycetes bacterium]|nr:phosphatase PAP2 family protein [Actinomycetes bacterium]
MDSSPDHAIGTARDAAPPGSRRARRRRRPTGEPPPLPRHLEVTGFGWMIVAVGLITLTLLLFTAGRYGRGISLTVIDNRVVEALANLRTPGLTSLMRGLSGLLGSLWTIKALAWSTMIVLIVYKRFRHLIVGLISFQVVGLVLVGLSAAVRRPRPFGVEIEGAWAGWAMPSRPVAFLSAILVTMLYSLVPKGRWRQAGKWAATGLVTLLALARVYLGVDTPSDVLVGAAIGVTIPLLAYRWFTPNEVFPVSYRRGRTAHLDVGGERGQAIRRALADQLGLEIEDVKPFGLSGSAGSTPLRIKVKGDPPTILFGKLYARSHLRSDRWYKLGRELLYGRLEDEKPFHTVRRLVQQEDYALHKLHFAGLPTPRPYGFVELTPDREYLLVFEFFDGAVELGEAEVDDAVIDDGLGIIRKLWDAGL